MAWFDNHCHVDDHRLPADWLDQARAIGVTGMITVGTNAERSESAIAVAAQHDDIWATVGLHPHDAIEGVHTIVPLLDRPKVVAIGECGLDYHYDHSPRPVQRTAFEEQIGLAHERGLPLVIHTRSAWDDTFAILAACGAPPTTIFHCFSGGPAEAERCLAMGAYLSFSGIVTFPTAGDLREAAVVCPMDRLLVETDSPYLAPVPHRGRTNHPALVPLVGAAVAAAKEVEVDVIESVTNLNARVAFRLAGS